MPSRASIARFLKISLILFIAFFLIRIILAFAMQEKSYTKVYEDNEAVLKLFEENKSEFDALISVMDKTGVTRELMDEYLYGEHSIWKISGDSIMQPKTQLKGRECLSEAQYNLIYNFFEKYGPYSLGGVGYYDITFFTKHTDISLYHINATDEDALDRYLYELSQWYEVGHIDGCWYFAISDDEEFSREVTA